MKEKWEKQITQVLCAASWSAPKYCVEKGSETENDKQIQEPGGIKLILSFEKLWNFKHECPQILILTNAMLPLAKKCSHNLIVIFHFDHHPCNTFFQELQPPGKIEGDFGVIWWHQMSWR